MRNRRNRSKFIRAIRRKIAEHRHREEQRRISPCPHCGRRAGMIAMIGFGHERLPGCEHCVDGLPGEQREPGRVAVIQIVDAPTREELIAAGELPLPSPGLGHPDDGTPYSYDLDEARVAGGALVPHVVVEYAPPRIPLR